jgi:integrase
MVSRVASTRKNSRGKWLARWVDAAGTRRARAATPNTRASAQRLAEELQLQSLRQREGLEALPSADGGGTVAELFHWWLETYAVRLASHASIAGAVRLHLLRSPLAPLQLKAVRPTDVRIFLDEKEAEGFSPQTVNHLRSFLSRAFNRAIEAGRWTGRNPVEHVRKRRQPRSAISDYLRPAEIPAILAQLPPRWRPVFVAALYTGMRKGELLGLKKQDVDLEGRILFVRRSWNRETTKGGHGKAIPIAEVLVPWLESALRVSSTPLVFPDPSGRMYRRDIRLELLLRRALGRAGIAESWRHVCRRKGCGYVEETGDLAQRRCPRCDMKLWAKPKVRHVRFHDLRHTTATLLLRAGVPLVAVQKVLRHEDPKLTTETYGHLEHDFLRAEIDRLKVDGMPSAPAMPRAPVLVGNRGTPAGPKPAGRSKKRKHSAKKMSEEEQLRERAILDSNQWPSAPEADALSI